MLHRRVTLAVVSAIALSMTAACTSNGATGDKTTGQTISVTSTDDGCDVSAATAPAGNLVFSVTNDGDKVTEFYLYGEDGTQIVGEVENIGPGLSRELVLEAAPGKYVAACKPGMTGDGIRQPFTVTDSGDDSAAPVPTRS